jgi:hypothetical protein
MRSSRRAAIAAGLLGALAIAAIPVGIIAAQRLQSLALLHALYVSVPIALVLGLVAVLLARRARLRAARSVYGSSSIRVGRLLAWAGLLCGITGSIALVVYGALRWAQ